MAAKDAEGPADKSASDEELLARFCAGEQRCFDGLVLRYRSRLQRLVLRYVKDEAVAKDVTQSAFVRAFEHAADFRGASSFRTWLFRIAVHAAIDHVRRSPETEPLPSDDLAAFTHSLQTSRLVAAEMWRKVSERLDELPPKQRLIVELRLFHDLSFAEIGAIADCSEDSARVNYHHAVKRLRGLLEVVT